MKDARLIDLKFRAEKDRKLSHAAHRALALIVSNLYTSRYWHVGDEFPLPWSWVGKELGTKRHQSHRLIKELCAQGYLKFMAVRKCPPTCFYTLNVPDTAKIAAAERESAKVPTRSKATSRREEYFPTPDLPTLSIDEHLRALKTAAGMPTA